MKSAIVALASASTAAAHATFQQLWVNGEDLADTCVRAPASNSPVTDVSSPDMACNAGASAAQGICEVAAGDTIAVEMHQQPGDRECSTEAIGGNHFGPVMVYLSSVEDAAAATGSDPFFKIAEFGYDAATETWGTDVLNENCGQFEATIPADLPEGDYLLRAEAIALHTASQPNGAQFYMSCYEQQIHISGGSGGSVPEGVNFPGAYSASDPGIQIDIWTEDLSNYQIPGPAVVGA
ncbi:hypothetical protein VUR80DRAFT_1661 [Thermomyces stellatus]